MTQTADCSLEAEQMTVTRPSTERAEGAVLVEGDVRYVRLQRCRKI